MANSVSTRVQLRRVSQLDRDGALAYRWRTTTTRGGRRRSWTDGVLLADEEDGVTRVGAEVEGFTMAASVLADVRRLTGRLPAMVDLRFDQPVEELTHDLRGPRARRSRYDRPDRRGETLGERAARQRRQDGDAK